MDIGEVGSGVKCFVRRVLDAIFPPKCIFCNCIMPIGTMLEICEACHGSLPFIRGEICRQCGQPVDAACDKKQCMDCSRIEHYFVQGISVFEYKGIVKKAVIGLKFFGKRRYAFTLGHLMSIKIKEMTGWIKFDIIIYTPLHKKRLSQRGFNQAELLAKVIAKQLDRPLGRDALLKIKHTRTQSRLTRFQRQRNMHDAFKINPQASIENKIVLLIDDVYTTGATANECARQLKNAGAKEVYVATAAIGKGTI